MAKKIKSEMAEVKDRVACLHPDHMGRTKDGTIRMRWCYFYRHGRSDGLYAAGVQKLLPDYKVVSHRDHWAKWPAESYFEVVVAKRPPELTEQQQMEAEVEAFANGDPAAHERHAAECRAMNEAAKL